ncbi:hypothetical protein [Flavobacterium sp. AG291]|uniref:hypothetical protein n=1 Tax=Flavobacterium sp. AG291 TaxID=2184000 RepID=UPI000E0BB338|nr:hypothetical protein [Flavobacterium sp. AG291]RDI07984.1 hypothetical protein DEU42_11274 [Flavobacterium sp. AG291]
MKADVQYNDFVGTAAADISDNLGTKYGDYLDSFGKYFKINEERFKVVGISIYGTEDFHISLYCIDNIKTAQKGKEHIVDMSISIPDEDKKDILDLLFKRLHIVLHSKFDTKYSLMEYAEEIDYDDYHNNEE